MRLIPARLPQDASNEETFHRLQRFSVQIVRAFMESFVDQVCEIRGRKRVVTGASTRKIVLRRTIADFRVVESRERLPSRLCSTPPAERPPAVRGTLPGHL